jgi:hypothetical protein
MKIQLYGTWRRIPNPMNEYLMIGTVLFQIPVKGVWVPFGPQIENIYSVDFSGGWNMLATSEVPRPEYQYLDKWYF